MMDGSIPMRLDWEPSGHPGHSISIALEWPKRLNGPSTPGASSLSCSSTRKLSELQALVTHLLVSQLLVTHAFYFCVVPLSFLEQALGHCGWAMGCQQQLTLTPVLAISYTA
jgi:hypothetical protein